MATLSELEDRIGLLPAIADNKALLLNTLQSSRALPVRVALKEWIVKQGIPQKAAANAIDTSLASAYCVPQYLRSWRSRINPNFDLLAGDDDDAVAAPKEADTSQATPKMSEAWLNDLYAQINKTTSTLLDEKISKVKLGLSEEAKEQIKSLAQDTARALVKELMPPRQTEIINRTTGEKKNIGLQHECFPKLLRAAQATAHNGFRLNIWLTGQPGSGKTHAAQAVATALDLPFEAESGLDADFKVMGYRGPDGTYHDTAFFRRFTCGGVMLMDEIDNFAPSALLALNSGTANDFVQFPHGMFKRHKDFLLIACANTWGLGATNAFVGRTRLDAASLDRFMPKINWTTDEKLERAIAASQAGEVGLEWHDVVLATRRSAARQGLQVIVSPRATFSGISLLQAGFDYEETIAMTLAAGLSPEQVKALGLLGHVQQTRFVA